MIKAFFFTILGLIVVVGFIGGGKALQIRDLIAAGENAEFPATTVSSEVAKEIDWQTSLRAVGAMESAQGVVLTADVAGRISAINFEAGNQVRAGDLLVEQEVSAEKTQLAAAIADRSLAKSRLDRVANLYKKKLTSRSEYDAALAAYRSTSANTQTVEANLKKKQIIAPFDGRLGLRQVNLGQTISAGTPIVSLQSADPMLLNFSLPQQNLQQVKPGFDIKVTSDAVPSKTFTGKITAIDTEIDVRTRSINIQATLSNPDGELLPGMFTSVDVILPKSEKALIIPITSISYASYGDSVFIIEEQDSQNSNSKSLVARQQFVQLGATRGDYVAVLAGVNIGQRVASAGVFKLRNGAQVKLNEEIKSELQLNPQPADN